MCHADQQLHHVFALRPHLGGKWQNTLPWERETVLGYFTRVTLPLPNHNHRDLPYIYLEVELLLGPTNPQHSIPQPITGAQTSATLGNSHVSAPEASARDKCITVALHLSRAKPRFCGWWNSLIFSSFLAIRAGMVIRRIFTGWRCNWGSWPHLWLRNQRIWTEELQLGQSVR